MIRSSYLPLLFLTLLIACEGVEFPDEELAGIQACGVKNPMQNLPWLRQMIEGHDAESMYCQPYTVIQGTFKEQTVYIIYVSGALCCTCGNVVYNCEGEDVLVCNREEEEKISNQKIIWEADH